MNRRADFALRAMLLGTMFFGTGGCVADQAVAQVLFCYSVDPVLAAEPDFRVYLCARSLSGDVLVGCDGSVRVPLNAATLDLSQAFVQDTAEGIDVEIAGVYTDVAGRDVVTSQRLRLPFREGTIVDATLSLEPDCRGRLCGDGDTCVDGRCVPAMVPSNACLNEHGTEPPTRASCDRRTSSACFP